MSTESPKQFNGDRAVIEKAVRLIVGRVGLVLLLLVATFWRTGELTELQAEDSPDSLLLLFSVTFGISIAYLALLKWAPATLWQVRGQFAVDVVGITWLVMYSGDIISPYVTLYVVLISVAGFFLSKTETLVLAIICATAFTTLSVLASMGVVYSGAVGQQGARVLQIVGVNDIAILLVGLLAARLSERRRLSEELKHTEESFADLHLLHERIVESIGSGLITTDLAGRIYAFNRSAEELTSVRAADAIGKRVTEILSDEMGAKIEQCLDAARSNSPATNHFETGFQNDGRSKQMRAACTIVPLLGKSGKTSGLIVTLQDVTQVRDLEDTVRRSDRLAAVGRMAAGLAHEIRNPLGSMSSALQFLQGSARPAEEMKLMDIVLRESDRMNNIITNFLAFARPGTMGLQEKHEILDVGPALKDCVSLIRHSPEATKEHDLVVRANTGLFIEGDETQLKQVCWNLARNALQAMPEGGSLSVDAFAENGHVVITFEDSGVGIDPGLLDQLFEPFVSGSGGTGLGLSIVHRIVQEHGGRISVDSERGRGTKIRTEFPRARV